MMMPTGLQQPTASQSEGTDHFPVKSEIGCHAWNRRNVHYFCSCIFCVAAEAITPALQANAFFSSGDAPAVLCDSGSVVFHPLFRRLWDFGRRKSDAKDVSGGDQGGDSGVVTLWSAKEKATATARHFIVDITGPGRYRLVLATLSPKWMVNRTLGFVATVKAHSLLDNVTLEMGSPEFLQNVSYFVVTADDCPAQVRCNYP
jgi:hypothetical protein